jgi:hypothetical protein
MISAIKIGGRMYPVGLLGLGIASGALLFGRNDCRFCAKI